LYKLCQFFVHQESIYSRFLHFHALILLIFFHNQLRILSALENPLALMQSSSM